MHDPVLSTPEDQPAPEASWGSRLLSWVGAVLVVVIVLVLFMHVFAPPIGRDEPQPPGHPGVACIACHIVTASTGRDGTP